MAKAVTRRSPTPRKVAAPAVPVPFVAQEDAPALLQPASAIASASALIVSEAASDVAALVETSRPVEASETIINMESAPESPAPAEQEKEIMATAAETIDTATTAGTDRAQAIFGDFNQRAKSAFEKGGKAFEDMVEFSKGNVEAIVASGRVAAKGAESLLHESADYGRKSFEKASGVARSYAAVKSPTELFQLHSEFAKSSFDSAVAEASRMSEAYVKFVSDVFEPLSGRVTLAVDKFKASAL